MAKRRKGFADPGVWASAFAVLLMVTMPGTVCADEADSWEYEATLYLWGSGIQADLQTGGEIDVSFSDIVSELDMAFMGTVAARKGKWSLLADTIYLDISQDQGGSQDIPLPNQDVSVDLDIDLQSSITTFGGGYNIVDGERLALDLVGGIRYTWVDVETKLDVDRPGIVLPPSAPRKVSDSENLVDGVLGVRGQFKFGENWYLPYYADAGTGDSDLTWQVLTGLGYKAGWGDVLLAYRYLDYELDDGFLLENLTVDGPVLGVRLYFR